MRKRIVPSKAPSIGKKTAAAEQLRYSLGLPLGAGVNQLSKALRDYGLTVEDPARWWQVDCKYDLACFRSKVESRIEGIQPVGTILLMSAVGGFVAAFAVSRIKYRTKS